MEITAEVTGVKPLSMNRAYRGIRYKTKDYLDYIEDMMILLPKHKTLEIDQPLYLKVRITLPKAMFFRSDVDNFIKPLLDILVKKEYLVDDRYVNQISICKVLGIEYKIEVKLGYVIPIP